MQWLGTLVFLVVVFLFGSFIYQNVLRNDWIGIYESRTDNGSYSVKFSSKEECNDWLQDSVAHTGQFLNFECGKNCEPPKSAYGYYRCSETF